jgi:hypothetical protein
MGDVDLLITATVERCDVMAILKKGSRARLTGRRLHADTYVDAEGFEYDLHWYLLPELTFAGSSAGLWQRAQPMDFVRFMVRLWNLRGGREVPRAALARIVSKLKAGLQPS